MATPLEAKSPLPYRIRQGDTLSQIARRHGTTVSELMRLNGLDDPHRIRAGSTLRMPQDTLVLTGPERRFLNTAKPMPAKAADVAEFASRLQAGGLHPKSPFLKAMVPAALAIQEKYGLPAEVILAQAALESNWGKAAIGTYNVFGIKGKGSLGSLAKPTREFLGGLWTRMVDRFAHFASYEEAFEAYARLLQRGRLKSCLEHKEDPVRFARALQGTYATDPRYAAKLISVMRNQGLIA